MSEVFSSYKKAFSSVFAFFVLCLSCISASFALSFPFFYLATLHKGIYTILCISALSLSISLLIIGKIVRVYKATPRRLFSFFINLAIIVLSSFLFVFLAINFHRMLALVSLIVILILYILFVPLLSKWAHG